MERFLRKTIADAHIAAVAIAVLLVWSLGSGIAALARPLLLVPGFVIDVLVIHSVSFNWFVGGFVLIPTLQGLLSAVTSFGAAWLLSRWVYGVGPFRSLIECRTRLARRNYA